MKKYELEKLAQCIRKYVCVGNVGEIVNEWNEQMKIVQSQKENIVPEQVREVDKDTIYEVASKFTRCVDKLVNCVLNDYESL
ncbi:MAG: hypothetical protein LBP53_01730 [Candidatus Peribacteria bacterium]|jgi:hypothetical protein|nr:hypothetical protein [Candidatus Peribacteria bacterium]